MARKILNRKEMRADFEAAERRKEDEERDEDEDEVEGETAEAEDEAGAEEAGADDGEEKAPPAKKAKPAAKPRSSRSRAAKAVRMKVVWVVYSNSNQKVAAFDYPKRREAEELAAKLTADKKSTHFVQPVKEAMEEKKE